MTGGVVAIDPSTNLVRWKKPMPYELAHFNGILTTASDLLFIGQPDGNLIAMDATSGRELWRFQTGAAISASPITYEIDGQQYVAILAQGTGIPYGTSAATGVPLGDNLIAFKLGATQVPQQPTPKPPALRRPVSGNRRQRCERGQHRDPRQVVGDRRGAVDQQRLDQRRVPDLHADPGRHHGDVHEPRQQREHPLRDPVLRGAVQLLAGAGSIGDATPSRRRASISSTTATTRARRQRSRFSSRSLDLRH